MLGAVSGVAPDAVSLATTAYRRREKRRGSQPSDRHFDPERGGSFVRLSFAGPTSDIEEALRRMGAWLPGQT